ncbi:MULTISPECIES: alpha/beta hydrolase family protein [unclassified Arthrobacter]|uniref:alpha/beta hydrolase family protein n=1 Tax=unclassified Arthrobacter TaxID=235627 RepID=UPI002E09E707|nr:MULTISPECIES: alpha/beta family hydrolase [unclassified Arthrobacter]MEC5190875.1 putative alpha/beta-hydrolase family hydrolase [Arthrobacter sp. MP_M4]MEC5202107.1 putative alpha/beta-hydrolase family hydrolase [Arthrobacter sp. MP_M7]
MTLNELPVTFAAGGTCVSGIYARPAQPSATVVVAHGAGAGMEHPFLTGFTRAMNRLAIATLRFNFPYRETGRKFPDRPPAAIAAWRAAMAEAAARSGGEPLWAAGKSFGGRMASMAVAEGMPAAGLIYLGYPLHPPGKPEKLRDEHLYGLTLPMLFLQGTRDPFATPELLEAVVAWIGPTATLEWLAGGNHTFDVARSKRNADDVGASLAGSAAAFISARGPR